MCFCIAENVREQLIDGPCQNCGANTTEVICQRCKQMRFCSACKRHLPDHCYDDDSVKCQVIFQPTNICINLIYTSWAYHSLNTILVAVIGMSAKICTHSFGFERDSRRSGAGNVAGHIHIRLPLGSKQHPHSRYTTRQHWHSKVSLLESYLYLTIACTVLPHHQHISMY